MQASTLGEIGNMHSTAFEGSCRVWRTVVPDKFVTIGEMYKCRSLEMAGIGEHVNVNTRR